MSCPSSPLRSSINPRTLWPSSLLASSAARRPSSGQVTCGTGVKLGNTTSIDFTLTMESERLVCAWEQVDGAKQVIIADLADSNSFMGRPISAKSTIMHPVHPGTKVIALRVNYNPPHLTQHYLSQFVSIIYAVIAHRLMDLADIHHLQAPTEVSAKSEHPNGFHPCNLNQAKKISLAKRWYRFSLDLLISPEGSIYVKPTVFGIKAMAILGRLNMR
ncbi:hypothetical protein PCASD_17204 [Puccinia coronata f. sp. avenae]|uniref:Uncharacterized protein n=1 Tax=Puccinia coronata f. sp. avenae TaxID=200324 RepID=A0A2N5T777_9BASI|nr:hypothetical protein PCASD_17204 [Puccinia coronata f. sp. avenae]